MITPAQLAAKISAEVMLSAGKGLDHARLFLEARVKETVSVPAPRKKVKTKKGTFRYVATTRAIPGAPPRKLSGELRRRVTSYMLDANTAVIGCSAKSEKGFPYPKFMNQQMLEHPTSGRHPFIKPTFEKYLDDLVKIVGGEITLGP